MALRATLSLLLFSHLASCARLWTTHYSGNVHTLTFTDSGSTPSLTLTASDRLCGSQPSWLTLDSAKRILYCQDETYFGGSLTAINAPAGGSLTQLAKTNTIGNGLHTSLYGGSSGNSFIAIAHYSLNAISTFALPLTSGASALQSFTYQMAQPGPNASRQDKPHPHEVLVDPTGAFLLVPDLGADTIRIYSINKSSGRLTSCSNFTTAAGVGPRHGAFWQDASGGRKLYIVNELASSITPYTLTYPADASSGCLGLTALQTVSTYPAGRSPPAGSKAAELRISGNGIAVSNRGDNTFGSGIDSLATFAIGTNGQIAFQNLTSAYGSFPRSFSLNKAGTYAAIATQNSAVVAVVRRDPSTGELGTLAAKLQVGAAGQNENGGLSSVIWDE